MKKRLISVLVLLLSVQIIFAQNTYPIASIKAEINVASKIDTLSTPISSLENTAWTGMVMAPISTKVTFEFGKDIFKIIFPEGEEQMKYSVQNGVMEIAKIAGGSPCPNNSKGRYKVEIKNDTFFLKMLSDECDDRGGAFSEDGYKKK